MKIEEEKRRVAKDFEKITKGFEEVKAHYEKEKSDFERAEKLYNSLLELHNKCQEKLDDTTEEELNEFIKELIGIPGPYGKLGPDAVLPKAEHSHCIVDKDGEVQPHDMNK